LSSDYNKLESPIQAFDAVRISPFQTDRATPEPAINAFVMAQSPGGPIEWLFVLSILSVIFFVPHFQKERVYEA
jgi:hypothetical protein